MAFQLWKFFGGISLKPTSAPTLPESGDMYFDSTADKLFIYQNGAFSSFSTLGGYVGTNPEVGGSSPFVMTSAHNRTQVINVGGIIRLPSTNVKSGDIYRIVNRSASELNIQSSGANSIDNIYTGLIDLVALQNTPTSSSHWHVLNVHEYFTLSQSFSFPSLTASSFTLNIARNNREVCVHLPSSITRTSMGAGTISTTLGESRLFPVATHHVWAYMQDNGSDVAGAIRLSTSGLITFYRSMVTSFTGGVSATGLVTGIALTYRI